MMEDNFMTCFTVWIMLFYTVKSVTEITLMSIHILEFCDLCRKLKVFLSLKNNFLKIFLVSTTETCKWNYENK